MADDKDKDKKKKKGKQDDPDLTPPEREVSPAPSEGRGNFVTHIIAKHGSAEAAIGALGDDNVGYRRRHDEDVKLIERLQKRVQEAPEVEEGGRILTEAEVKEFDAYKALGTSVEVKKKIDDGVAAAGKVAEREATDNIAAVAAIANDGQGWNAKALTELAKKYDLTLSIEERKVDGEKVKVAMVTPKGESKAVELESYVDEKLNFFKPALEAGSGDDEGSDEDRPITPTVKQDRAQGASSKNRNSPTATVLGAQKQRYPLPSERRKANSETK
jgi:hypothetical protein